MRRKYIVVYKSDNDNNYTGRDILVRGRIDRGSKIEGAEFTDEEAKELYLRDDSVYDVFRAMPLKLIKPRNATTEALGGISAAWGIEAVGAHTTRLTGEGIKVAILDTGITDHAAFPVNAEDGNAISIKRKNYTSEKDEDTNGHGTHCAGIILGRDVESIRIGIARGIKEVFVGKVIGRDGADIFKLIKAVNDALEFGAHVISMSLGFDFPGEFELIREDYPKTNPRELTSILLNTYRKNTALLDGRLGSISTNSQNEPALLIAAAGNESNRPEYTVSVAPPAVVNGFISVGAIANKGNQYVVAKFSNSEPILCAPGVRILSARHKGGLKHMDGTSMAVPHVAGIAALWAQYLKSRKQFTHINFQSRLIGSCKTDKLSNEKPVNYGMGIVQVPPNLY